MEEVRFYYLEDTNKLLYSSLNINKNHKFTLVKIFVDTCGGGHGPPLGSATGATYILPSYIPLLLCQHKYFISSIAQLY